MRCSSCISHTLLPPVPFTTDTLDTRHTGNEVSPFPFIVAANDSPIDAYLAYAKRPITNQSSATTFSLVGCRAEQSSAEPESTETNANRRI